MYTPSTTQIISFDTKACPFYRNHNFWHKIVSLLPHKSSLLIQTRAPSAAQSIIFDTKACPFYHTNHYFWHKNVTILPHKLSVFAKNVPFYRTNHNFWHKNVSILQHKSSLLTQNCAYSTVQIITFDTKMCPFYHTNHYFWHKMCPFYHTNHHFWHKRVHLLLHKSSFLTQKRAIRAIAGLDFGESTNDSFKELNLLKLKDLYEFQFANLMWDQDHELLPRSLNNLFLKISDVHIF